MAADMQRKRSIECPQGTLAPADGQSVERAESPTPGLAQGMEPGAGQEGAMFVHARSYEDLTEPENGAAPGENSEEGAGGPPPLPADMRQISQDFSELSTQLTGVARDLQEEMLPGSSEDWAEPPGASGRPATEPPREGAGDSEEEEAAEAWRLHQKHVFVLSEAGKPVYSRYGSEEALSSTMGVMVALVSFLEADKNAIRSIHADGYKVVFVRRSPLVLVAVARTRQSAQELTQELLYIYYSGLFTSPEMEAPYTSEEEQERLLGLYQYLHSRAHNASRPLKTIYYTGPNENLLAWVTGAFELYMCYSPLGTKASAVDAIHKLMRWIRKEEDRLFILTPLTY
ncbi:PREDICTED: vacuolar fusion protein MON1 homolog A [Myotis davidii]|uniref:vacuolar fusion protein MON1 homolog A n=1 Tax=Myotis davidii TaxID=225400 RepID=UPI0003EBD7DB|nr:PREDICTED: vacuolar fusion protein MON1 homolog A [Myotis davidii]